MQIGSRVHVEGYGEGMLIRITQNNLLALAVRDQSDDGILYDILDKPKIKGDRLVLSEDAYVASYDSKNLRSNAAIETYNELKSQLNQAERAA